MKSKEHGEVRELLQEHGYRVTSGRVRLLSLLQKAKEPLTATKLHLKMNQTIDKVTLYRALEDFVTSKIVTKVNLQEGSTYYEFLHIDHHHHHVICEVCGKIEDIESCDQTRLQKEVLASSRNFKIINSHSLEFFGVCIPCSRK